MRWPFRYWSVEPRFIAKGDDKACWECRSGSVYRVVVLMPYWDAVLLTRRAISPRLAINILLNGSVDSDPDAVDVDVLFHLRLRLDNIVALPPRKALNRAAEDIGICIPDLPMRQNPFYCPVHGQKSPSFKCFQDVKSAVGLSRGYADLGMRGRQRSVSETQSRRTRHRRVDQMR